MSGAAADPDRQAVRWLLASPEPAIRRLTRRDLLGQDAPETDAEVLEGPKVAALLAGQRPNGGIGGHVYSKWKGAHWRLVSLLELGVPASEPRRWRRRSGCSPG